MANEQIAAVRVKLAAAWASLMSCYIYADYFGLFEKGKLATMNLGQIPPLGAASDQVMLFVSAMMAIPSLMIFLSVALASRVARGLNLLLAAVYSAMIAMIMRDSVVLSFFGIIEIGLGLAIFRLAWNWRTISQTELEPLAR